MPPLSLPIPAMEQLRNTPPPSSPPSRPLPRPSPPRPPTPPDNVNNGITSLPSPTDQQKLEETWPIPPPPLLGRRMIKCDQRAIPGGLHGATISTAPGRTRLLCIELLFLTHLSTKHIRFLKKENRFLIASYCCGISDETARWRRDSMHSAASSPNLCFNI
ncbi:hypothetical protein F5X99DRAFT_368827 [Biscogniauxia marginata]|nr:hypothetical protein F5X99DRAFT_368827 [Biscogniauxia marginata]